MGEASGPGSLGHGHQASEREPYQCLSEMEQG